MHLPNNQYHHDSNEHKETYGEKKVRLLLTKLRKAHPKDFYWKAEPIIHDRRGRATYPDFVVLCRHHGIAAIEVKDWVEIVGGNHEIIKIKRRDGTVASMKNPEKIVLDYARDLARLFQEKAELLTQYRGRSTLSFPWHPVVIFPNLSRKVIDALIKQRIFQQGAILCKEDLKDEKTLQQALYNLNWRFSIKKNPLTIEVSNVIRAVIDPSLIENPVEDVYIVINDKQEKISREALNAAEDTTIRLVRGVAGSGKSLVLMHRARYLKEHHPDCRILVMTFNKDLAGDLEKRIGVPDIEVVNFHKMCSKIISAGGQKWPGVYNGRRSWIQRNYQSLLEENNMSVSFMDEEIKWRKELDLLDNNEYLQVERKGRGTALGQNKRLVVNQIFDDYTRHQQSLNHRGSIWADWEDIPEVALHLLEQRQHPLNQAYDVVLLDEAQDFAPAWIEVVKKLLKSTGTLFMCDDPTQSLFRYFSWMEKGIDVRGRTRRLSVPFRSTRSISEAAHALVQEDSILKASNDIIPPQLKSSQLEDGYVPAFIGFRNESEEQDFINFAVKDLLMAGKSPQDIAILCHDARQTNQFRHLKNDGIQVRSYFTMKGLEYKAVILPSVQNIFKPDTGEDMDDHFISKQRRQLFTAMTRARETLIMSYCGQMPQALEPMLSHLYQG